jgi:hypothetical protein
VGKLKKMKHKRKEVGEREKEKREREGLRRAVQMAP